MEPSPCLFCAECGCVMHTCAVGSTFGAGAGGLHKAVGRAGKEGRQRQAACTKRNHTAGQEMPLRWKPQQSAPRQSRPHGREGIGAGRAWARAWWQEQSIAQARMLLTGHAGGGYTKCGWHTHVPIDVACNTCRSNSPHKVQSPAGVCVPQGGAHKALEEVGLNNGRLWQERSGDGLFWIFWAVQASMHNTAAAQPPGDQIPLGSRTPDSSRRRRVPCTHHDLHHGDEAKRELRPLHQVQVPAGEWCKQEGW